MYFQTHSDYECSGCTACVNICTHHAITMQENKEGFLYPVRDVVKCINCGLCEKICPPEHPVYKNSQPAVYAAYDKKARTGSSSGGLFFTIANHVIHKGGLVFGAAYADGLKVKHVQARTIAELEALRGSKYVQSDLGDCFKQIKEELQKGTLVYFSGVGCQVAGLYAYLRKNYENLITSDIVCHGVPSQQMFNMHLSHIEKKHKSKVTGYSFRDPRYWLIREEASLANGKKKYEYDGNKSPFLYAFGLGYTYRMSCFHCPFAKIPRQGDISLADYWGVDANRIDTSKGVSLVLLNNLKGKDIWKAVKGNVVYFESSLQDCIKNNPNVVRPTIEPEFRKNFFRILNQKGYEAMTRKELVCPPAMRNKRIERIMLLRNLHIYQPYTWLKHKTKTMLVALKLK